MSAPVEEVASLQSEVEALRADAERYRWLRDRPFSILSLKSKWGSDLNFIASTPNLDAAIDAARAAARERVMREAQASAAVAELIEADKAFDAARLSGHAIRIGEATARRRAALARVGGGA